MYLKIAPQRDSRVKVSALFRAGHKVSEVANLVGVSRTTVYAIKKHMDDGEGVNRRAGSGWKPGRVTAKSEDGRLKISREDGQGGC